MEDTKTAGLLDGLLTLEGGAKTAKNTALNYKRETAKDDPWSDGSDPIGAAVAAGVITQDDADRYQGLLAAQADGEPLGEDDAAFVASIASLIKGGAE